MIVWRGKGRVLPKCEGGFPSAFITSPSTQLLAHLTHLFWPNSGAGGTGGIRYPTESYLTSVVDRKNFKYLSLSLLPQNVCQTRRGGGGGGEKKNSFLKRKIWHQKRAGVVENVCTVHANSIWSPPILTRSETLISAQQVRRTRRRRRRRRKK